MTTVHNHSLLRLENISHAFDGVVVFYDFNFYWPTDIKKIAVIGSNGSGKTTLFNILSGSIIPDKGFIFYHDEDISDLKAYERSKRGIIRTFQTPSPFSSMTIFENVLIGAGADIKKQRYWCEYILELFGFSDQKNEKAIHLPPHQLRFLEVARCLAARPSLMLIDESLTGLPHHEVLWLLSLLDDFQLDHPFHLMMIEHNLDILNHFCEFMIVLSQGELKYSGFMNKDHESIKTYYL